LNVSESLAWSVYFKVFSSLTVYLPVFLFLPGLLLL